MLSPRILGGVSEGGEARKRERRVRTEREKIFTNSIEGSTSSRSEDDMLEMDEDDYVASFAPETDSAEVSNAIKAQGFFSDIFSLLLFISRLLDTSVVLERLRIGKDGKNKSFDVISSRASVSASLISIFL